MKRYILARATINPFMAKLAKMLKSHGDIVESLSIYEPTEDKKANFDDCHFLMNREDKEKQKSKIGMAVTYLSILKNIRKVTKPLKDCNAVIGVSEPNAFVYFVFKMAKCKKIFFPYDIVYFRYKKYTQNKWYDWLFEKRNFKSADGIIHKSPKYVKDKLPVSDKPILQFLPYADQDKLQKADNKLDGTHIVYVGLVYDGENYEGTFPLKTIFKHIADNKMHMHVYPSNYEEVANDKDIQDMKYHEYFHLHKPVYGEKFSKEISQYHWGLYMLYFDKSRKKLWADTVFGNKVADYIEAGLPILANRGLPFVCDIIEKYKIGLPVKHYTDIPDAIKNINYDTMQRRVSINRHCFTMDKHNHKIIDFLEEINNE